MNLQKTIFDQLCSVIKTVSKKKKKTNNMRVLEKFNKQLMIP